MLPLKTISTPVSDEDWAGLRVGDMIKVAGKVYTGNEASLPKLLQMAANGTVPAEIDLRGAVIFHAPVSPAGVGPTSSNKPEIAETMGPLGKLGVRLHIGKGYLGSLSASMLAESGTIFAVTPHVSALLSSSIKSSRLVALPELGLEGIHELEVDGLAAIITIAARESLF